MEVFLSPGKLPYAAAAARLKLSELAAKVELHLAMEDGTLYPSLMAHQDPRVRDKASHFNNEMSGIKGVFETYSRKWTEAAIRENPGGFIVTVLVHTDMASPQLRHAGTPPPAH